MQTKVFHVIVGLELGGAELMLQRLVEAGCSRSHQTVVVSLTSVGRIGADLRSRHITVHSLDMKSFVQAPMALLQLIRLIRRYRPLLVQTWMYHADLLGGLAARLAGCKNIIWGVRTTEVSLGGSQATAGLRWLCARWSGWLPHTIVCAANASRVAHEAIGYRTDRLLVIPNGFNLQRLQAAPGAREDLRIQHGLSEDTIVIGFLGRFNAVKDVHNFVNAAGRVARQYSNARFLMVGPGMDASNRTLAGWLESTGFADYFVLLGSRLDVEVCLAAMDVFALSSLAEGFPNVVGEAMAMRLPCVVTDVGDAAFLLGDCGVVVRAGDSVALAQGMADLLELSAEQRQALGEAARTRIESEFSMDQCIQRFEALYRDVLDSPRV
jgi:glycosyltransferase involved in cell wall biosynthesis